MVGGGHVLRKVLSCNQDVRLKKWPQLACVHILQHQISWPHFSRIHPFAEKFESANARFMNVKTAYNHDFPLSSSRIKSIQNQRYLTQLLICTA